MIRPTLVDEPGDCGDYPNVSWRRSKMVIKSHLKRSTRATKGSEGVVPFRNGECVCLFVCLLGKVCIAFCAENGHAYAGSQYSIEVSIRKCLRKRLNLCLTFHTKSFLPCVPHTRVVTDVELSHFLEVVTPSNPSGHFLYCHYYYGCLEFTKCRFVGMMRLLCIPGATP